MYTTSRPTTAVVIGAGIAGLASARVLADRFEHVVVIDRDRLPDSAVLRRGIPQGGHPHLLLEAGQRALEDMFPGLLDELVTAGANVFDTGSALAFHRFGKIWPPIPVGLDIMTCTRPLLELLTRCRVAKLPNVTIRDQIAVTGLTGDTNAVTGVSLSDGHTIAAQLVVDCSGRGTRSDGWLSALGVPAPAVDEVKIGVGYASRTLRRLPDHLSDRAALYVLPTAPHEKRIGGALPVEGDRWLIGIGGWHGELPTADETDFTRFARSLPHKGFAELLERADPLSDILLYRFPSSRWRRFDRLRAVPAGYVAVGDCVASVNPIYGQGMTMGILQARTLGETLDRHRTASAAMARAYFRAAAKVVAIPWRFAVGADWLYPETSGVRPAGTDLVNRYALRVQRAAQRDGHVRRAFAAVQHMVTPPAALLTPSVVARTFRRSRRAGHGEGRTLQPW